MLFCKTRIHDMTNSSIAFRLETDKIRLLKELGEEKDMPLSTLVNQIFKSHFEFDSAAPHVGFVQMQKSVLNSLFEALPDGVEEEKWIEELAINSADEMILY